MLGGALKCGDGAEVSELMTFVMFMPKVKPRAPSRVGERCCSIISSQSGQPSPLLMRYKNGKPL